MIKEITNENLKKEITNKILRDLNKWFGIEKSIVEYVNDSKKLIYFAYYIENEPIGFISFKKHFENSGEIYVMGILEKFHNKNIGSKLIIELEKYCENNLIAFLQVKTLDFTSKDENYKKTRNFYLKNNFLPLESFPELWGKENPCLQLIKYINKKNI